MFNSSNYYTATKASFTSCAKPETTPDYISDSGSRYWYTDEGVIRFSNHWGYGIASCDWLLDGVEDSSFADGEGGRAGYCNWSDFEFTRERDICVYGVSEEEADDHDCIGRPFKSITITSEMVSNGMVHTDYGSIRFNDRSFMSIDL